MNKKKCKSMGKVSDKAYIDFVNNQLTQEEMAEVENQLIEDNEIVSTIYSSIANYECHKEKTFEILGKKDVENARKDANNDSISVTNDFKNIKNGMMNINFSKEEVLKVQEIFAAYKEFESVELSMEENLVNFYLNQRPGVHPDEAKDVIKSVINGVKTFNENLNKALKEDGVDYVTELQKIGEGLANEQKYELYINFLASLQTLNVQNFDMKHIAQIENFDTLKSGLKVEGEVSDEMLNELIGKIAGSLNENTLCMTSVETLKVLLSSLPTGSVTIEEVLRGSEKDMKNKLVTSLATYIAYQNGDIESLDSQKARLLTNDGGGSEALNSVTPEVVAVAVACGHEQMQVMENVRSGKTAIDTAIKVLKIIGGVALWTMLALATAQIAAHISLFAFGAFVSLLGTGTIALVIASVAAVACCLSVCEATTDIIDEIMDWAGDAFDWVVNGWRETAWPTIKESAQDLVEWIRNLLEKHSVIQTKAQNPVMIAANT